MTITVNKATQTIVFPALPPVTYSPTLTVTLSATGGVSSNPVVFTIDASSTGQGSIAGNVLTVTQAGTFVIDANQAADANDSAAAQVQQVLVVNQASQTIAFTPITTPVHYISSCPALAQCAMISIQASGGATNSPIAISPDPTNTVGFTIVSSTTSKTGVTTAVLVLLPSRKLHLPDEARHRREPAGQCRLLGRGAGAADHQRTGPLPLQTITWANPGTQVVGGSLTLSATSSAGAGYPIAFTASPASSSVCTVSGLKPTFVGSGACTITASQAGDNTNFAAAIPLTQTFAVNASGQAPSMNMSLSLTSLTIQSGTVGLTQITINSVNNFASSG